jgi:RNA polymerase sigma-70 factor (ECF subfamily)
MIGFFAATFARIIRIDYGQEASALEDEQLWISQALRGDQSSFASLVKAYQVPVYNLCHRMLGNATDAEDAAQETFVRIYAHLKTYNPELRLSSWILSVASHYCIDRLRRRRIRWLSLEQILPARLPVGRVTPAEETVMGKESCDEVRALLQSLPAEYRVVIVLRYWQDLSYTEIAQIVGSSESAIKSRLHRARRMLAQRLAAQGEPPLPATELAREGKKVTNHALLGM